MVAQTKPLAEITHVAIRLLVRELGAADTVRFVNQFSVGYGDYTQEREALFANMTLDNLLAEINRVRGAADNEEPLG